ncbi:TIGR02594 family protein [Sphingosinicella microcystinivorans]|uniref:TIGR02594 family protein n=1 Tax=Sphingosinicella microcystinivorans TaxID=335406 RepID=UPI0022F3C5C5|nr:TIGR02594 family protein [Sphingosinicella microcystinivorans]WBX86327.1 TIGR02594 family protein [Sphingosinicella microcystinivorans]
MKPLPPAYGWIDDMRPLPRMLEEARKLYGTFEVAGPADNPVILGWAKETGLAKVYNDDSIPWCGLFMAVVAKRAGKPVVEGPLWARNWAKFGKLADQAQLGDILVFRRAQGSGHVGLYVGEDYGAFHVLGGNQSDGVTITRIARDRCIAIRRPAYRKAPASAKPVQLAANGVLSTNEA